MRLPGVFGVRRHRRAIAGVCLTLTVVLAAGPVPGAASASEPQTQVRQTPPALSTLSVTMTLPAGCSLDDLGAGGETPWRDWDISCRSLHVTDAERAAHYYRLYVTEQSEVRLSVEGSGSSRLILRSTSGDILASDQRPEGNLNRYHAKLTRTLDRGLYVIEVAAEYARRTGYNMEFQGSAIVAPDAYRLSDLNITDVALTTFDSGTTEYDRNVAADVSAVTVTPTAAMTGSTVEISPADADTNTAGHQVNLDAGGSTDIAVKVYRPDLENRAHTYTVALTELAGTTKPLSSVATLSALSLSGIDIGTFSANDITYPYSLGFYQALNGHTTTVTLTTTHSGATRTINPSDTGSASGHQVDVDGDDTITVTVTSQDGDIRRTYTLSPTPAVTQPHKTVCPCSGIEYEESVHDLWIDGSRALMATTEPHVFRFIDLGTEAVESFTLPAVTDLILRSFWTDGETLWVTHENHDTAYAYSLAARQRLPERDIEIGFIRWIWSDGTTMYSHDHRSLFAHDMETGRHLRTVPLEWTTPHPFYRGMWSDGITVWIPDYGPIIKAFNLRTGARVPGLDVQASDVGAVWSDGQTFWTVENGYILKAYTLPENARLKHLSLDVGDLGLFNNGVFAHHATVPAATTEVTVTATAAFTGGSSSVEILPADADTNTAGHQVTLITGSDTIVTVTVTAPNGTDTETYTVTVTEAASFDLSLGNTPTDSNVDEPDTQTLPPLPGVGTNGGVDDSGTGAGGGGGIGGTDGAGNGGGGGGEPQVTTAEFVDVDSDSVHYAGIQAMAAAGITAGCATGPLRYCPNEPVTRAQMATFLARALDL